MPSPVWKGALSFGMVNVPVRLFTARARHSVTMHQFEEGTSDRIRYRMVNERTGNEVPRDRVTKGAKAGGGDEYVILESTELESIAPGRSREMEINAFVPAQVFDPLWYDTTYYLAPDTNAAAKPYRLLYDALNDTERLGVASLVMRQREYLSVIGPQQGVLTLSTLYWPDEIREPQEVLPSIPEQRAGDRELDLAKQLIDAMSEEWRPEEYTDTYHERLEELIEAKRSGRTVKYEEQPAEAGKVVELSDALRASLRGKRTGGGDHGSATTRSDGRAPAQADAPLSELSKKELSRIASDLDIAGRSKMDRGDLESAISDARKQRSA